MLSTIQAHVDASQSPLAWKRVVMRLLPQIRERGFFLHTFKGDVEIDSDLVNLIDILMMHDGCKANSDLGDKQAEDDEEEIDSERLAEMYNEIRNCAWEIYKKKRREQWGKSEETTEKECEQLTGNMVELGPDFDALEYMEPHFEWDQEKFGDEGVIKIRNVKATEI